MALKSPGNKSELFHRCDLVSRVTELVRGQIVSGELAVGSELPAESRMCEMFNVSRTVVREAMRNLRSQGLVDISQGRRARVKALDGTAVSDSLNLMIERSEGSIEELLEFRRPVEAAMATLAAERATEEDLAKLARAAEQLEKATSAREVIDADIAFHQALSGATKNCIYVLMWNTLAGIFRQRQLKHKLVGDKNDTLKDHRTIYQAIQSRDGSAARQRMLKHLDMIETELLNGKDKS